MCHKGIDLSLCEIATAMDIESRPTDIDDDATDLGSNPDIVSNDIDSAANASALDDAIMAADALFSESAKHPLSDSASNSQNGDPSRKRRRLRSDSFEDYIALQAERERQEAADAELALRIAEEWSREESPSISEYMQNRKRQEEEDEKFAREMMAQFAREEAEEQERAAAARLNATHSTLSHDEHGLQAQAAPPLKPEYEANLVNHANLFNHGQGSSSPAPSTSSLQSIINSKPPSYREHVNDLRRPSTVSSTSPNDIVSISSSTPRSSPASLVEVGSTFPKTEPSTSSEMVQRTAAMLRTGGWPPNRPTAATNTHQASMSHSSAKGTADEPYAIDSDNGHEPSPGVEDQMTQLYRMWQEGAEALVEGSSHRVLPMPNPWMDGFEGYNGSYLDRYRSLTFGRRSRDDQEDLKALFKDITVDEELMSTSEHASSRVDGLKPSLMKHQTIGVAWMVKMENGRNKGGLLADEMGLGKTVQALALIVSNPSTDRKCKTTLVVCPVSLVHQWAREITSKTSPQLKVVVWHGSSRTKREADIMRADVVITTYSLVAMEAPRPKKRKKKRDASAPSVENSNGDESSEEEVEEPRSNFLSCMKFHRIILDESQWIKNKNTQAAKGCFQLKAVHRWCLSGTPIQNRVDEFFSVVHFLRIRPYHEWGRFRQDFTIPLRGFQSDANSSMRKLQALLKAIMLRRTKDAKIDGKPILTLPEKHMQQIKGTFNEDEKDFYTALEGKAARQVKGYLRKGQFTKNYANILVLLLRLRQACCHPWLIKDRGVDGYEVKTDVEAQMDQAKMFDDKVVTRIKEMAEEGTISSQEFECSICLDITKDGKGPILLFPCGHAFCSECIAGIVNSTLAGPIDEGHEGPKCPSCRAEFKPEKSVSYNVFAKVFEIPDNSKLIEDVKQEEDDLLAVVNNAVAGTSDRKGKGRAEDLTVEELVERAVGDEEAWISSTKIDTCVEILQNVKDNKPGEKTIVFSQFVGLLDLLSIPLSKAKIKTLRYDGSMNAIARASAVFEFEDNPDANVMLVSLKAGNVGLNLTCANHCIVMDPFWNPFVIMQAVDRVHRIGQTRETHVYKLSIPETVEDRILSLCDQKEELVNAAFSEGKSAGLGRLTQRDVMGLFNIDSIED